MIKSTLKIARYCPLLIQGFSNFLGLFQVIMANPVLLMVFRAEYQATTGTGNSEMTILMDTFSLLKGLVPITEKT